MIRHVRIAAATVAVVIAVLAGGAQFQASEGGSVDRGASVTQQAKTGVMTLENDSNWT
ncbi:hypothetical protein [Kitasatospora sp. NBC_01300]|uniref:hypothetical protein n=1 Tax=Kitasatospora sp. NBC_01300 TaxID=2903574 RepID=UPI00352EE387|nr:hypothetical protein OG556_18005 [Kitasatospora sp. NBC_01300]